MFELCHIFKDLLSLNYDFVLLLVARHNIYLVISMFTIFNAFCRNFKSIVTKSKIVLTFCYHVFIDDIQS
jgi:hypothetical protein